MMSGILERSLITGWLPAVLTGLGLLALGALLLVPLRRTWWRRAGLTLVIAAVLVALGNFFVTQIWRPFPDRLPASVLGWVWLSIAAVLLALQQLAGKRWRGWLAAGMAAVLVILGAAAQVNRYYGQYPTVGTALGLSRPALIDLAAVERATQLTYAGSGEFLTDLWRPPAMLSEQGMVARVHIPPTASGFRARPSYVYLPPAYRATGPRPALPVLVLLAGQPGNADSWLVSGQLTRMMDAFARTHNGLAPVVVMPDNLGANFANPLCTDSHLGNVETYLTRDVPTWILANLQIATDRDTWAVAGLSNGGTCALQLAVRAPDIYGRFIDISGEYEPLLDGKQQTIDEVFGGDAAAYARISPVEIMSQRSFPATAGRIVAGTGDSTYYPQLKRLLAVCEAAGMDVSWLELPGGHTWQVWRPGLAESLAWLAGKTRLAPA